MQTHIVVMCYHRFSSSELLFVTICSMLHALANYLHINEMSGLSPCALRVIAIVLR